MFIIANEALTRFWVQYRSGPGRWTGDRSQATCWPEEVAEEMAREAGLRGYVIVRLR